MPNDAGGSGSALIGSVTAVARCSPELSGLLHGDYESRYAGGGQAWAGEESFEELRARVSGQAVLKSSEPAESGGRRCARRRSGALNVAE